MSRQHDARYVLETISCKSHTISNSKGQPEIHRFFNFFILLYDSKKIKIIDDRKSCKRCLKKMSLPARNYSQALEIVLNLIVLKLYETFCNFRAKSAVRRKFSNRGWNKCRRSTIRKSNRTPQSLKTTHVEMWTVASNKILERCSSRIFVYYSLITVPSRLALFYDHRNV